VLINNQGCDEWRGTVSKCDVSAANWLHGMFSDISASSHQWQYVWRESESVCQVDFGIITVILLNQIFTFAFKMAIVLKDW